MAIGILLITHEEVGQSLLKVATTTLGTLPLPTTNIAIDYNCDPEQLVPKIHRQIQSLDQGGGVLILTDLFGSTPCNIACKLQKIDHVEVVAGLNLPMLIRVMNYPTLNLEDLAHKASSGGHDGIIECH